MILVCSNSHKSNTTILRFQNYYLLYSVFSYLKVGLSIVPTILSLNETVLHYLFDNYSDQYAANASTKI